MRSPAEHKRSSSTDPQTELRLLHEMSRTPETTQRSLANRVGISLGLTNLLVRNLAGKGYVRVAKANWRRRLYALTPLGLVRKVRLAGTYVSRFIGDYQNVRLILRENLESESLHAESRVAIYGTGEFADLVYLGVRSFGVEEIEIFDESGGDRRSFLGLEVQDLAALEPSHFDCVVVAELGDTERITQALMAVGLARDQLITFFDTGPEEAMEPEDPVASGEQT